jgi:hypothetical protein
VPNPKAIRKEGEKMLFSGSLLAATTVRAAHAAAAPVHVERVSAPTEAGRVSTRITRDEYLRKQKQVGYQPRITQDQDPRKTPRWQHQCVAK